MEITKGLKQEILNVFGKIVIEHVRDNLLSIAMNIAKRTTKNQIKIKQYEALSTLNNEQREAVCDLLSETITDTIYNFPDMFESNEDKMKLLIVKDGKEYDLN